MPREFALLDALVPTLLLAFVCAFILQALIDRVCRYVDFYQYVWHPALFRVSLFVCLFSTFGLVVMQ